MNKLYKYSGTVSSYSYDPKGCGSVDLILGDANDYDKPPIRLTVYGPMAQYIRDIESTDAEERYMTADWYYDRNLFLRCIEIPSTNDHIPAKIITQDDLLRDKELKVFGPREYIEDSNPDPMTMEQLLAWNAYRMKQ